AMGISQTGRFLRHLVYQGFNADEEGRIAYDALLVYVAGAGRGNFNHRFAQPSRDAQPLVPAMYPVDVPPFTDDGLLERARAENVVPKIFYVNTAYEYWSRGASVIHTTPDGARDGEPPPPHGTYVNLVPQIGPDGNEMAGVRLPELQVPLATYTGWNLRDASVGFPEYRASFLGSFIAWPKDEILARYHSRDEYFG